MPFQPPPGMISNETVFAAPGRWRRGSWVRFWDGNWQVKGGYERLTLTNLGGVCRTVFGWQNSVEDIAVAFGLHNGLKAWKNGETGDITPLEYPPATLAGTPLATTNATPTVVVTQNAHGYLVGQVVLISGAPLTNGIPAASINGLRTITAVTTNTWTFTAGANATSTGNGGAGTVVANQTVFIAGQIDGTGGRGYGTGAFGVGTYGTPSDVEYWPLTWSLSAWGGDLMASPRNGPLFRWDGNFANKAVQVVAAPANITVSLVNPQRQVMAFGCNEEASGVFNPLCIRWSDIEDYTDWTSLPSNNAGEYILEAGARIVAARVIGDYVLVWTAINLFLGTFLGDPGQTWKFEQVGSNCGAIGPNAPVIRTQNAMWVSPDRQFWTYSLGGAPQVVVSPVRDSFSETISQGQADKIVGATTAGFGEVTWFYPDSADGLENSRSVTVSADGWSGDLIARSAYVDAGPHVNPIGVSPDGWVYWHEKGHSADGAILQGFLESSDFYIAEADGGVMVNGIWPDFKQQIGVMQLRVFTREYPQSVERTHGPWSLQPDQRKRSFRLTGRIARVRYDFASAPVYARGGKPEFDVQEIGGR